MQKNIKSSNVLKYVSPAGGLSPWEASLPIGNGKVGGLIQGGVMLDRMMISDSRAIWKGAVGVLPDVSDKLKDVRSSVASRNSVMAGVVLQKAFSAKKYEPKPYTSLPIADLVTEQLIHSKATHYQRMLGMETEEVCVQYQANSTKFERNAFVSFENDMIYYEFSKEGNESLDLSFALVPHDKVTAVCDGVVSNDIQNENFLVSGSLIGYEFEAEGIIYGAMARVLVDSKAGIRVEEDKLTVEDAEKVLLVIKTYVGKQKDKLKDKVRAELLGLRQVSYEKAFKSHLAIYQKKISRVELSISKEKDVAVENMLASLNDESTLIYEKLFNYGKYLLTVGIPNEFNSPLVSGIFGKHYNNPKACAGMSVGGSALYSSMLSLGMEEKYLSLLNYFTKYSDDLKKCANRIYKSKGYMVPDLFVSGSALPASIEPKKLSTITASAVVANMFYDYFLFTKDMKFLKTDVLPFMTSVADFYINYFYRDEDNKLVSCPSFAPDGVSKYYETKDIGVYENSTCDFVVAKALINNIISLANVYSVSVDKIVEYQNFVNALPSLPLEKNSIKEYRGEENSVLSSGIMHLYDSFGSKNVHKNVNPSAITPYLNSVVYKIDKSIYSQNLIALGRLAQTSANLGQAGVANNLLKVMIKNNLSDNLMFLEYEKHNLGANVGVDNFFNIAGNSLFCSVLLECFVLDYQNNIAILPSKPEVFREGRISNVITKQNVVVGVEFDDKRGNMIITLKATRATKFNLILPKGVKRVKNYTIDLTNPRIDNIILSSGKSLVLDIKY